MSRSLPAPPETLSSPSPPESLSLTGPHDRLLEGHAGLSLIPYEEGDRHGGLRRYRDWRVQVTRSLGPVFVSVGVNGTNYPVYSETGRARVFATISHAF
ncbi:MAG: hypothetical protein WCL10_13620 [Novosphingobium sp.]|uniref:hypothetical protein n=1 Tax=Novosphingobium sp. TaxID=1874826 RepID=UPI0030191C4D